MIETINNSFTDHSKKDYKNPIDNLKDCLNEISIFCKSKFKIKKIGRQCNECDIKKWCHDNISTIPYKWEINKIMEGKSDVK